MAISPWLRDFAAIARASKEYQGHGWGCAWRTAEDRWELYKSLRPVWEDDLAWFPKAHLFVAHARSAFRNEGIRVENNMPFQDEQGNVFLFNGEVRGVAIRERGRIGAEKIFNFIKRFHSQGWERAIRKGVAIIERRSRYVRAMNILVSDGASIYVSSRFNEEPEYFTMHYRPAGDGHPLVVCSDPLPGLTGWTPIASGELRTFS